MPLSLKKYKSQDIPTPYPTAVFHQLKDSCQIPKARFEAEWHSDNDDGPWGQYTWFPDKMC